MVDQALVTSGYDVEVLLGERYLQYLLLLALDAGVIPVELTFGDPPILARVSVPPALDRTYEPDPAGPQPEESNRADAFGVEILVGHPLGADLRVTLRLRLIQGSVDVAGVGFDLFVRLGLAATHAGDGSLESAGFSLELVDVGGGLVDLAAQHGHPKAELVAAVKAKVDRTIDLSRLGSGDRIGDVALRKFAAVDDVPAALGLYLNLRLKTGPQPDAFLGPRGDVLAAQNVLVAGADVVFVTRHDIYGDLATDAYHRRAVSRADGFHYPLMFHGDEIGTINGITIAPSPNPVDRLRIEIQGEVQLDWLPDPDFTAIVDVFADVDDEGVMSWGSATDVQAGLLAQLTLAVIAVALTPITGGWSLAVYGTLQIAGNLIVEAIVEDTAQPRVDATMLDISPSRLTIARRRWDPFYVTHHQSGLRPGGSVVNAQGLALWGTAVLTRTTEIVRDVVIRDAERDPDGAPTALRYRVEDIDPFRELVVTDAPGVDRRAFTQPDAAGQPYEFQVTVDDAVARIADQRLLGAHPYLVERIQVTDHTIDHLLVISQREHDEQQALVLAAHEDAARAQISTDNEATIRQEVIDELTAAGVVPTTEQIEAKVQAALDALVAAELASYGEGQLAIDLDAALLPLLKFELAPAHLGELQHRGVLTIADYDLVLMEGRYYYRDHFDRRVEDTTAKRLADNLRSKPHYHSTPNGPVFP